ncbi:recombinase family protein [Clostridium celatum]|uniref:recombinase family protein n=1 Tax=Clostridium celatum TaxID=36834 RepID=UPI00189A714B
MKGIIKGNDFEKINIIFYLRKSKAIETGMTFDTQRKSCENEVLKVFGQEFEPRYIFEEDDVSGGNSFREEYCKMKEFINNNKCVLFVYSLDRLIRDVAEGLILRDLLIKNKCDLYVCKIGRIALETPEGKEQFINLCNSAEIQLNITKRNQAENLYNKAEMSIKAGSQAPYGYVSYNKEILVDDQIKISTLYKADQIEIYNVVKMYQLYYKYKAVSKVTRILVEQGVYGKYGKAINKNTVLSVLRNPVNVKTDESIVEYFKIKGFEIKNIEYGKGATRYGEKSNAEFLADTYRKKYFFTLEHEGVIDSKLWIEVQKILDENSREAPKKGKSCKSVIGNTIKCKCGANMKISTMKKDKQGNDMIYYCCTKSCGNKNVNGTNIEVNLFNNYIDINSNVLAKNMKSNLNKVLNNMNEEYKVLKDEIAAISRSNEKLLKKVELLESNKLARTHVITQKINDNEVKLSYKIEQLKKIENSRLNIISQANKYISYIEKNTSRGILEDMNFDIKKMLWECLFKEIIWNSDAKTVFVNPK